MSDEITTLVAERAALIERLAAIDARLSALSHKKRNGVIYGESLEAKLARTEQIIAELKQEKRW